MLSDRHEVVHVAILRADGGVSVMQFITRAWSSKQPEVLNVDRKPTTENIEAEVTKAMAGQGVASWHIVDPATLPASRDFRGAWRSNGKKIAVDMTIARGIHLDALRAERVPALASLDVEWMKAVGRKDQATADAVEAERQSLRDLPTVLAGAISAAKTPEQLRKIALSDLPGFAKAVTEKQSAGK